MTPLRLAMVTRRYWPLVGGPARALSQLAAALNQRDVQTTVVTARWGAHWPEHIMHRGVRVARLPLSQRAWGEFQYQRRLAAWLREQEGEFDVVYVSQLKHDAATTIATVGQTDTPVVLRAERAGLAGDCHWQLDARFGYRIKRQCMRADSILAPNAAVQRELIAAGYPREKIHLCQNGDAQRPLRDPYARAHCRTVLAEANPALTLPVEAPLAVCLGDFLPADGFEDVVKAWRPIVARWPGARLWLIGEGPGRSHLLETASALGLDGRVLAPGVFDEVDDLLMAADVAVFPSLEVGDSPGPLEAMSVGLPVVVTDVPGLADLVTHGETGMVAPAENPPALADAIRWLLERPDQAAQIGKNGQRRAREAFPLSEMIDRHVELFQQLTRRNLERTNT